MYHLAVAASLLMAPPGTPESVPDDWPALQVALHETAIAWEILDSRETAYVLSRVEDFENDLNLLRRRYQDLKDAPPLSDSFRWPERRIVNEWLRFNRAFRKNMEVRMLCELDRAAFFRQVMDETDKFYAVWDNVRDARCEFDYVTVRRQALRKLKQLIGDEDYQSGILPDYVPTWRFMEIK